MIRLENGRFIALVRPEVGGSLAAFRRADGTPILRDALRMDYDDPRDAACFPLVPFSNRILDGSFDFRGRAIRLRPNVPHSERVAHGFGWRSSWMIEQQNEKTVLLAHTREASDWPWTYRAEQAIELLDDGLALTLRLRNLDKSPMPAGLGWHPFLPLHADTRLTFSASASSLAGPDFMPMPDGEEAQVLSRIGSGLDPSTGTRYFSGYGGAVAIEGGGGRLDIESSPTASEMILYLAPDSSFFCIEPVTHRVGAFNRADRLGDDEPFDVLEPGAALTLEMRIRVGDGT